MSAWLYIRLLLWKWLRLNTQCNIRLALEGSVLDLSLILAWTQLPLHALLRSHTLSHVQLTLLERTLHNWLLISVRMQLPVLTAPHALCHITVAQLEECRKLSAPPEDAGLDHDPLAALLLQPATASGLDQDTDALAGGPEVANFVPPLVV
eukprot:CAMPEP_0172679692 /NCGR_PEP_ID=MMETSP1074-20121228/16244_1 /TAXON_ID=2916 /ORGANISM="Ceratium fusus, Strain PA161109" /LENGTH=150 /DNA_ID=CAMNT_0013497901 /DNA_START=22 /DNA_END=473 /DNA_ORIENTATION=-